MEIELRRISIVGLGRLGLPFAACFAGKGFPIIGVDIDPHRVKALNEGVSFIYEPGLQELINVSKTNLMATQDVEKAIMDSDVTFIVVPTPSDKDNKFSLQFAFEAGRCVAEAIRKKSTYHLVVLMSTVTPGSMENELKPLLESRTKKVCGKEFGFCYNPEFVALGNIIHDFINPDFILIGESDAYSGGLLTNLYARFCDNNPPVVRMNFVNAELTKLAVNGYVTLKITFANLLARICERLPGSDVDIITSALGLDTRIGSKYLKGAIGYGGPCFPRDVLALIALIRNLGISVTLPEAVDAFNQQQIEQIKQIIKPYLSLNCKVGILGLAYKPDSDVTEESQGIFLAQSFNNSGVQVIVYDPAAMDNAKKLLSKPIFFAKTAQECIHGADIVVITTPWKEFTQLLPSEFSRPKKPRILIDCWRILSNMKGQNGIVYLPLGVGRAQGK